MTQPPLSFRFICTLALYSNLLRLVAPFLRIKAIRRGRKEPGYLHAIDERFARYDKTTNHIGDFKNGSIWIHAVSLGETKAAQVLIKALLDSAASSDKSAHQSPHFLLTHSTATGRQAGLELIRSLELGESQALQVWYPWDTPGGVDRFLNQFKPSLGLLMETEVWPNMVMACYRNNLPLILVNARMNEKSFKSAKALGLFAHTVYQRLTAVFAQAPADAKRLKALGAPVVGSFGNLKFDASVDELQRSKGLEFAQNYFNTSQKSIILLASSREGEEALLFHALVANKLLTQGIQWLIVPRHPQRFDEVQKIALQFGFAVSRRIAQDTHQDTNQDTHQDTLEETLTDTDEDAPKAQLEYFEHSPLNPHMVGEIWIGDSVGEMPLYYGMAKVALLGGSFEPLGGQNLIEAAACACPVVMGPHVFNFTQAAQQAIARGAAIQTPSLHDACQRAHQIALNPAKQTNMSRLSIEFASENRGAVSRTIEALKNYI